jgi:hypothetical protein
MKTNSLFPKFKDHLLLLVFAVVIYWPVSFMVLSLKNDAINYFLPIRYNLSEAIHEGFFPWWSPYINLGYPLHGDMQSGVWNPFVLILSVIRKYDIYWLHVETLLVVYLSGISMYHLLKHLRFDRKITIAVALAYMGCGYIVDSGQFLNWLYAAALLPLVFLSAVKCFSAFQIKDAFFLGLTHSLMFLCSYPADFILLSYILFFFFVFSFYNYAKKNGWGFSIKIFALQISASLLTFLLICLPAILSYTQFMSHVDRGAGVSLEQALSNSLAPANLISFLLPWGTLQGKAFAETDPLIRNCYMGTLLFFFFLYFLFTKTKKTPLQKFLIGLFFVVLIFSLGKFAGLRQITYYTLPLMNTFRHPANAKLFFIFSGQIIAAFALQDLFSKRADIRLIKRIFIGFVALLSVAFLFSLLHSDLVTVFSTAAPDFLSAVSLKKLKDQLSFADYMLLNSVWALFFLIMSLLLLKKGLLKKYLTALVFADVFVIAQLMLPLTYVSTVRPQEANSILQQQPRGYPLPKPQISLRTYSQNSMDYFALIGCLNPLNKLPGRASYPITPSNLSLQDKFWADSTFREKVLDLPLAFFADTIVHEKNKPSLISNLLPTKTVLANTSPTTFLKNRKDDIVEIKKFDPNYFEFYTTNPENAFFVLHQNYYPNWLLLVNGRPVKVIKTNVSFMGGWLPAGENKVQFIYKASHLKWLGIFSLLFALTGFLIFSFRKK